MNNWERIPATRMVTVSYRKWMRLKANVNWKLKEACDKAVKEAREQTAKAEQAKRIAELSLEAVQNHTIEWMEKYEALKGANGTPEAND